jgi:hypothetical protein
MRTTKKELLEMVEDVADNAQIVLKVRGNSTTDYYTDETIVAFENSNGVLIIMDSLSR